MLKCIPPAVSASKISYYNEVHRKISIHTDPFLHLTGPNEKLKTLNREVPERT